MCGHLYVLAVSGGLTWSAVVKAICGRYYYCAEGQLSKISQLDILIKGVKTSPNGCCFEKNAT